MDTTDGSIVEETHRFPDSYSLRFPWRNVRWTVEVDVVWEGNEPEIIGASVMHADWIRIEGGWAPLSPVEVRALFMSDNGEFKLRTTEELWKVKCSQRN